MSIATNTERLIGPGGYYDRIGDVDDQLEALERAEDDAMKKGLPGDKNFVKKKTALGLRRRRLTEASQFIFKTIEGLFALLKDGRTLLSSV